MTTRRVPIIGIVGGIGCGKSAMASAFEAAGCTEVDADTAGHEMLLKADILCELVTEFGNGIIGPDNRIDRSKLAAVAFASDEATGRLNAIVGGALWPEFRRRAMEAADHAEASVQAVVLDAALLYESETDDLCDAVVFVDAPDDVRRLRIETTRGWNWEEVLRRESRQIPLSRKRELADFVVSNHCELDHLRTEADRILAAVRERFFSRNNSSADATTNDRGKADQTH
jgi:dephospho-CoA kinase